MRLREALWLAGWAISVVSCRHDPEVTTSRAHAQSNPSVGSASDAGAPSVPDPVDAILALSPSTSRSIGGPNDGRVEGAIALPLRGPGFRFGPLRSEAARYGTVEVVQSLILAAREVERAFPGSEVTINDLGLERGGAIAHHGSHRAGRDVDVLFYMLDASGRPVPGIGVPVEPDGTGVDYRDLTVATDDVPLRIDVARSWAFVAAMLTNDVARVQRIFVVEHVRTMLLEHARASGADPGVIARFEDATCQPSYPHDDHFHFRFFCSSEDIRSGCTDSSPLYPWHLEAMRASGVTPVLQRVSPNRPRARITTDEEARADAGTMHEAVVSFLARREAWKRTPHPGRRYCR